MVFSYFLHLLNFSNFIQFNQTFILLLVINVGQQIWILWKTKPATKAQKPFKF